MKESTLIYLFNANKTKVLLQMRAKNPFVGKLNGCGGKLEQNEDPFMGVVRELTEETGYKQEQFTMPEFIGMREEKNWRIHVFVASLLNDLPPMGTCEPLQFVWLDINKINEIPSNWFAPHVINEISVTTESLKEAI